MRPEWRGLDLLSPTGMLSALITARRGMFFTTEARKLVFQERLRYLAFDFVQAIADDGIECEYVNGPSDQCNECEPCKQRIAARHLLEAFKEVEGS